MLNMNSSPFIVHSKVSNCLGNVFVNHTTITVFFSSLRQPSDCRVPSKVEEENINWLKIFVLLIYYVAQLYITSFLGLYALLL